MTLALSDELFDAQLCRTLGYAPYGGADLGECLAAANRITHPEVDAWYAAWFDLAERVRGLSDEATAAGDAVAARSAFFRAANAYRSAGLMLMQAPIDERLRASHRAQTACFRRAAALLDPPAEIVAIPFEGTTLPGYFFRAGADGVPRPTVILTGGYDGAAEELYFANGAAALARGYHVLAFDGPGQGAMLIEHGMPMRPDWETVMRAVVDAALGLPGVDGQRLALIGLSLGGHLAPRAASGEHRLSACVSDCGPYDLYDASMARIPAPLAGQVAGGNRLGHAALEALIGKVMRHPTHGWALRRNLLVHGIDDPFAFFALARDYTLKGREAAIRCPTFVCTAEGDDLSSRVRTLFDALTCPKRFVAFTAAEGAGGHCEPLARTLFHQRMFAWLAEVMPPAPAA
jgi:pimeloyl-ACP methyl ester carboxylesterase